MKILFCNITYMNHYTGNIEEDIPQGGGAWVKSHKDAHEKWNFLNVNGYCYGFVMNKSDQFHIERLENTSRKNVSTKEVTIVWCAPKSNGETVIVGWYEHATVYRYYQDSILTPIGLDRCYFTKAKAEDCYLLPENKRNYVIGRAAMQGMGKGFGQCNFWYADSEYAKEKIVPSVIEYLQQNKKVRINHVPAEFEAPENIDLSLSPEEQNLADQFYNENEYLKFLPLGYRAYRENPTGDNAYFIASALRGLHQYSSAVNWYQKVIQIEGNPWDASASLPYLLTECERFSEAVSAATKLLDFPEANNIVVKHEIYSSLADNNYYMGRTAEAVSWLDKIISESEDRELIDQVNETKKDWLSEHM